MLYPFENQFQHYLQYGLPLTAMVLVTVYVLIGRRRPPILRKTVVVVLLAAAGLAVATYARFGKWRDPRFFHTYEFGSSIS